MNFIRANKKAHSVQVGGERADEGSFTIYTIYDDSLSKCLVKNKEVSIHGKTI
ncbi:hypothetical protein J41TS2_30610 [Bacillus sonorensis]|nr:hypothetical protein J41TS2_30610 [Bacillus sonorensis]